MSKMAWELNTEAEYLERKGISEGVNPILTKHGDVHSLVCAQILPHFLHDTFRFQKYYQYFSWSSTMIHLYWMCFSTAPPADFWYWSKQETWQ